MKSRFLQYLPCDNNDFEVPNVENSNQKAINNDLERSLKIKRFATLFEPDKQVPKSLANRQKSCHLQLRVRPAAPMVLQGSPEVPKWPPKVLPRCQNGSPRCSRDEKMAPRMSKRKHRGSQMVPKWRSREAKGGKKEGAGGRGRSP